MSDPYVAKAVAEAQSLGAWVAAQFGALWSTHKTAVLIITGCAFVAGCVIH